MSQTDVFLSHARTTSGGAAAAVHDALASRGISAFLDSRAIEEGDDFPAALLDGLFGARIVVIFADSAYFRSWYCLWEWRAARAPFLAACERPDATNEDKARALEGLVIVLPDAGASAELERFPPQLRNTQWPRVSDPEAVADFIEDQLTRVRTTLRQRLDTYVPGGSRDIRADLSSAVRLPPPLNLQDLPRFPSALPASLDQQFVGRGDDLWRIDDLLAPRAAGLKGLAALTGALQGIGGVGKTRLMLEYIHRFGPKRYPGGVFLISARTSPTELEATHYAILAELHSSRNTGTMLPTLKQYRDGSAGRRLLDDLLHEFGALRPDQPALVVIDDIPEPEPGQSPLPLETWCPMRGLATVLLTSRLVQVGETGSVAPLPVDVLSVEAAVQLLAYGVPSRATLSDGEWQELAEWVGRLPLALTLLHSAFVSGGLVPRALLDRTRSGVSVTQELDGAMDALRSSVPAGALRGVTEAFLAAYGCLPGKSQLAARVLAQGAPTPIPEVLLTAIGQPVISTEVRATLITRSVITPLSGAGFFYGTMHGVLADFLRARAPNPEAATEEQTTLASALLSLSEAYPSIKPTNWPLWGALEPHATAVAKRLGPDNENTPILRARVADWMGAAGNYAPARDAYQEIVSISEKVFGPDDAFTLSARGNVARFTGRAGDPARALQLFERLVPDFERALGPEDRFTLVARGNLAYLVGENGDPQGALYLLENLRSDMERILGPDDPDVLTHRSNVAAWIGASGDPDTARQMYVSLVADRIRLLGPDDQKTLLARHSLGFYTGKAGDLTGAIRLLEELLPDRERVLGVDHPDPQATRSVLDEMRQHLDEQS